MQEIAYWNEWNQTWREGRSVLDPASERRRIFVLTTMRDLFYDHPSRNYHFLEIGCGTGWLVEDLLRFGRVDATDLAADVVTRAQERIPQARFFPGDFNAIDFPALYDAVVCLEAIAHVPDRVRFVGKIAEVLHPGGYLILTTQNRYVFERMESAAGRKHPFSDWLTRKDVRDALEKRFRILRLTTIFPAGHLGVLRLVNSTKLAALVQIFGDTERIKERLGFGQTITVLAQKR